MASLLIAGYGFLGRALENKFLSAGWNVDKLSRGGTDGCIRCDISSSEDVSGLSGDYDLIIHCAASGGGGEASYRRVYLEGVRNLLARFPDARLVFTSSTSVYSQTDHGEVTESSAAIPATPTAKILREAEETVIGARGVVTRLSGLYGPGRCHVLKNLLSGTATLDGKGGRIMNFIHRDDVARAVFLLGTLPLFPQGEIFNVTAGPVSQHDCYAALARHFDRPMPASAVSQAPRKRGNSSKKVSNAKLKNLGWSPQYNDFLSLALNCRLD
ncbi:MAG: NAD-dependent epimerase/dehydratase family protein [Akkermansiaceae bacterium]|nr:NAD-dependent epimerase/dehydratase family protein [Akkermansiaceae bacterium]